MATTSQMAVLVKSIKLQYIRHMYECEHFAVCVFASQKLLDVL